MEEEKEYILYFYDGKVRRMRGKLSELRKLNVARIEEAPSAFPGLPDIQKDIEGINRAMEEAFGLFQRALDPQVLLDRIEALHPDQAPLRISKALEDIFQLPLAIMKTPPSEGNSHDWRS